MGRDSSFERKTVAQAGILADALQVSTDIKELVQGFYKSLDLYMPGLTLEQKAGAFKVYCAGFMLGAELSKQIQAEDHGT